MNMSFWNAATGAQQQQLRFQVLGNNIANINTYGYKAEKTTFSELMNRKMYGIEEEIPRSAGTRMMKATVDFSANSMIETGREFDFAIVGDGFFGLLDPKSGEVSYTRCGAFTLSEFYPNGQNGGREYYLADNGGRMVLNSQGGYIRIDPHADFVSLDNMDIGVFDFAIRDGMEHIDNSRFVPVEKNGEVLQGSGTVRQKLLESSNTDFAGEIVKVIESQRAYSFALKMVTTSDEIETTINNLR